MVKAGRVVKQPNKPIIKLKRPGQSIKPTLVKRSAPRKVTAPPPKTRREKEEEEEEVEVIMEQGEDEDEVDEVDEVTEEDVNFIDDSEAIEVDTEYATSSQRGDEDEDYDQSQENNYSDDEEYDEAIEDSPEQPREDEDEEEEEREEEEEEEEERMTRRIQPRREVNKTDRQIPPSIAIAAEVADFSAPSSPPKDEIDLSGGDKDGDGEGVFKTIDEKTITPIYNLGEGSMSYITKSRWGKVKEGKGNKKGVVEISNEKEYLNGCIKKKYIAKGTKEEKEMVNWMKIKTYFKLGKSIEMQRKYLAKHLDIHYDADGNVY